VPLSKLLSLLRNLFSSHRMESELDQEVKAHLQMLTDENIRAGMPPHKAQRAARIELGGVEQLKEQVREERLGNWLNSVFSDCRFALRQLRKSPSFTAVAILTLALGIGATTAIFSFADLLLNHPVSLSHLDRLVSVDQVRPDGEESPLSPANFRDLHAQAASFQSFTSYQEWSASLTGKNGAGQCNGVRAGEEFFATLEAAPLIGRTFSPDEHRAGKDRVVILSYAFWQREFAGDPQIIDKALRLNEESYDIVGVMPASFQFPPGDPQFWIPLALSDAQSNERTQGTLSTVGLLNPGTTIAQTRAELNILWNALQQRYPGANRQWNLSVLNLRERLVDEDSRQFAILFLCVSAFVLLIACVNVANLQLARAAGRERELSIRAAVGSGRGRMIRQLFTESIVLAAIGGVAGLLLAVWAASLMRSHMPAQVRQICDVSGMRVDLRAFFFTLFVSAAAGLLSGAIPAIRGSRLNLREALEAGGARNTGGGRRLRQAFVVSEVILAVVLLIGAGLMVKGFYLLANQQTAMAPNTLLTFHLNLSPARYVSPQQQSAFYAQVLERLRNVPGVESASAVGGLPFSFYENEKRILADTSMGAAASDLPAVMQEPVSSDYFGTMRLPLLTGRPFDQRDSAGTAAVAIISESLAQHLWPGTPAVGHRLQIAESGSPTEWITVVGVVGNVRHEVYDRAFRSILYRPLAQAPETAMDFALRTSADPHSLMPTVRSTVAEIDPAQPISVFQTMTEKIQQQASALQFVSVLMGVFGLVAVLLSAAGIYGLIAGSVADRRREIGIRMALGARPRQVLLMVVKLSFSLVAVGGAIGLAAGFALAQLLSSMLYGVHSWDPAVYLFVPVLLIVITLFATFVPAIRAARVDPMVALRYE
jgi:putative ABC transport system permease protein